MFVSREVIYFNADEQCHWQFADVWRCVSVRFASREQTELVGAGRSTRSARAVRVRRSDGERRGGHRAGRLRGDREPAAAARQRAGAMARHASSGYSHSAHVLLRICVSPCYCHIGAEPQHSRNDRASCPRSSCVSLVDSLRTMKIFYVPVYYIRTECLYWNTRIFN